MLWIVIGLVVIIVIAVAFFIIRSRSRNNDGPVSLVFYRTSYRNLTEADVRGAARRALGFQGELETIPFDEHTKGVLLISENTPPIAVITSNRPYIDAEHIDAAAASCEDPKLRDTLRSHKAWLSIDAMGIKKIPSKPIRVKMYNELLGKLAAEFLDDATLMIYAPAENLFGEVNSETSSKLSGGQIAEIFDDDELNAPIIHVENSDEAINTAIATAQKRLPEFIAVIESGRADAQPIVKSRFSDAEGNGEHMWSQVSHMSPTGIVASVMNRAANPALPKKGDTVTIKLEHVSDWIYVDEKGKRRGGFVEKVLTRQ